MFAASVAGTIGLGLGVLCSAFTVLNAYILAPIDLPDPYSLHGVSWDTASVRRHQFSLDDFEALRDSATHFASLAAVESAVVMQDGATVQGALVTGNYFEMLGKRAAIGRTLMPGDASSPGASPVVVLSNHAWQTRYGADPAIVGTQIALGRQRFEVVGVMPRGFGLTGDEFLTFWAPLTMARAFAGIDPWSDVNAPSLTVLGRLRESATASSARAWLDVWLRQRYPAGSDDTPIAVTVEPRGTRIPMNGITLILFSLIQGAFALVLLVACANVTNLMLARALGRQQEIAVRLSLGASRWRVMRQLMIESIVLAVPASAVGFALTVITARVFPQLILATFPPGLGPVELLLEPLDPDLLVITVLCTAAVLSAVIVSVAPALRTTRTNLVRASRGEASLDVRRSRLRSGLVAMQIGACALFLVAATGLIDESTRLATPDSRLSHERVQSVRIAPELRPALIERLGSEPSIERIAAAWHPPLVTPLTSVNVVASQTRLAQSVGFMAVSPDYFPLFDIRVLQGRAFTTLEGDDSAPVALVSEATARRLWPGLDPIGQTLDIVPSTGQRPARRPTHSSVRIIGVTEDVVSGTLLDGVDSTIVYFAIGLRSPGEVSLLVRGRSDLESVKTAVTTAVNAIQRDAVFQINAISTVIGFMAWVLWAFTAAASFLGIVGLLLAFSGTYAVVSFLVTQRTREFGIRMALGASVRQIVGRIVGDMMRTAAIGIAVGLGLSIAVTRAFRSTIVIIPDVELGPYLIGAAVVLAATTVAALLPSFRTTRIDPSKALRVE
jgi:predicted permease